MIRDVAAQNASLDNDYGATHGPHSPSAHELALFNGDPTATAVELAADGGYARVSLPNDGTSWPGADGGATSVTADFPFSTGAWSDTATWWALYADDGTTMWDCGPLEQEISVDQAGEGITVTVTVYYNQEN